jgi:uncharacterized membrane protein YqhA
LFSVLAVTLFLIGSYEIIISIWHYFPHMQKDLKEANSELLVHVIGVLIVTFFERVLKMEYSEPLDMLYFAVSIFALSFGVYLIKKHN